MSARCLDCISSSDLRISVTSARRESRSRTRASNRSFDWRVSGVGSCSLRGCSWGPLSLVSVVDSPSEPSSLSCSSFSSFSFSIPPSSREPSLTESADTSYSLIIKSHCKPFPFIICLPFQWDEPLTYIRFRCLGGILASLRFRSFFFWVLVFRCSGVPSFFLCFRGALVLLVLLRFRAYGSGVQLTAMPSLGGILSHGLLYLQAF